VTNGAAELGGVGIVPGIGASDQDDEGQSTQSEIRQQTNEESGAWLWEEERSDTSLEFVHAFS
jgi:hypothetical protein